MLNSLLRIPIGLFPAITLIFILTATLLPSSDIPDGPEIPHLDKAVHFLMFGLLSAVSIIDWGRLRRHVSPAMIIIVAGISTSIGAALELVQQAMDLGRSADLADLFADALGAFILPLVFLPQIRKIAHGYWFQLIPIDHPTTHQLSKIRDLYHQSFPIDERRPWPQQNQLISDPNSPLHLDIIYARGRFAGFITWWTLDCGLRYIEHFAILPSLRGRALGSIALSTFIAQSTAPIVLEVEPAGSNPIADRRIAFYQRLGLTPHHNYTYIQPPYDPALPSVPLTLMTTKLPPAAPSLPTISTTIHRQVYNQESTPPPSLPHPL